MSFLSGLTKGLGIVTKIAGFIANPMSAVTSMLMPLASKFLDKLGPIGQMVKPFAEQFLGNAGSFLSGGGLGALGSFLTGSTSVNKLAATVGGIAETVQGGIGALSNGGFSNLFNMIAGQHANILGGQ